MLIRPPAAQTGTSASRPAGRPPVVVDPVQVDRRYRHHVLQVHLRPGTVPDAGRTTAPPRDRPLIPRGVDCAIQATPQSSRRRRCCRIGIQAASSCRPSMNSPRRPVPFASSSRLWQNSNHTQVRSRRTARTAIAPPPRRANLHWKQLVQGRAIMFGEGFKDCWYEVPGVPGLELSWRPSVPWSSGAPQASPRLQRATLRPGQKGRGPSQVVTRRGQGHAPSRGDDRDSWAEARPRRVRLPSTTIRRNNWPENLYLGDHHSNAADSLRNGGRVRGDRHPCTKIHGYPGP